MLNQYPFRLQKMRVEFISVLFLLAVNGLHLPEYIKPCRFDSPDFMKCATEHGSVAISHLVKGDRAYGIPSFTPFEIPFVSVDSHGLQLNLTDASFFGLENLKLQRYIIDPEKKIVNYTMGSPYVKFEFDYTTRGKIAALSIEGNGHGWAELYNGNYTLDYVFEVRNKNGKHYIDIGDYVVTIEPERLVCEFGNLFNGNKLLGDNVNKFLNENWREILVEFNPIISEVYGSVAKKVLKKFFDRIPVEEIYPGMVF